MSVSLLADRCILWLNNTPTAKVYEEVNRKCPPCNMTVQLSVSTLTSTLSAMHSAQRHRRTEQQTDTQTTVSCQ